MHRVRYLPYVKPASPSARHYRQMDKDGRQLIALIPGKQLVDASLEDLAKIFEQMFGRKVTPEEIEKVREAKRRKNGE